MPSGLPLLEPERRRSRSLHLLLLVAGLAVLAVAVWRVGLPVEVFLQAWNPIFLSLSLVMVLVELLFQVLRFRTLLQAQGKKNSFRDILRVELINRFSMLVLPFKLNVPLKALLVERICRARREDGLALVALEMALDSGAALLISSVGLPILFPQLTLVSVSSSWLLLLAGVGLLVYLVIPDRGWERVERWCEKTPGAFWRVFRAVVRYARAIRWAWFRVLSSRNMGAVLLWWAGLYLAGAAAVAALLLAQGITVPLLHVLVITRAAVLVGNLTAIPSGLGVREAAYFFLFTRLGVPGTTALSIALMTRLVGLPPAAVGGLMSPRWILRPKEAIGK